MCLSAANRAVAGARSDHSERRENPSALYRYVSPCKTDCRYDKKARLGQPAPPPPPHCESGLPNYARGTNSIFFGATLRREIVNLLCYPPVKVFGDMVVLDSKRLLRGTALTVGSKQRYFASFCTDNGLLTKKPRECNGQVSRFFGEEVVVSVKRCEVPPVSYTHLRAHETGAYL
eukprot:7666014-Pyramimonas_sp.AAC.1